MAVTETERFNAGRERGREGERKGGNMGNTVMREKKESKTRLDWANCRINSIDKYYIRSILRITICFSCDNDRSACR